VRAGIFRFGFCLNGGGWRKSSSDTFMCGFFDDGFCGGFRGGFGGGGGGFTAGGGGGGGGGGLGKWSLRATCLWRCRL